MEKQLRLIAIKVKDFVYDIEHTLKDEIENRVKIAMHEAAIFRYTLEIEIGTLF